MSHHGSDTSGSAALVHALRPRAAIMNNGPWKGGAVQTCEILRAAPSLEDVWQNHHSVVGGREHNRPDASSLIWKRVSSPAIDRLAPHRFT